MEHVLFNIGCNIHDVAENTKNLDYLVQLLTQNNFIDDKFDYKSIKLKYGANLYDAAITVYKSLLTNQKINQERDTLIRCLTETGNEAVSNILKEKNCNQPKSIISQIWFDIEPPSIHFVGQEEHLINLEKWFLKEQTNKCVVITGNSGIGKSELARKFAKTFYLECEGNCIWLSASNNLLNDSFQRLVENFGQDLNEYSNDEEKLTVFVWEIFSALSNRPCLLIIDDITNHGDNFLNLLIEKYILWKDHYLIITSRTKPIKSLNQFKEIELENLSNLNVKKYFSNIFDALNVVSFQTKHSNKETSQSEAEKKKNEKNSKRVVSTPQFTVSSTACDINKIVQKNLVYFAQNVTNITELLIHLVQDDVISEHESETIKAKCTSLEQGQELFSTLLKIDMNLRWKSKISKILRKTRNEHLVKKINESLPKEQPQPFPAQPAKVGKFAIVVNDDDIPQDPFGLLNSICNRLNLGSPSYEEKGPFSDSNFECCCTINKEMESETAKSKKQAKRRVAYKWLLILKARNPTLTNI